MPAPERIPAGRLSAMESAAEPAAPLPGPARPQDPPEPAGNPSDALLAEGELTVRGRIQEASNAVLYCTVAQDGHSTACVYKPVAA